MKLHTDTAERTFELSEHDLADRRVLDNLARNIRPTEMVYAPLDVRPPVVRTNGTPDPRDMEDRAPVRPARPDPARLDALRAALAARGLALHDEGCFYARIVTLAPARRVSREERRAAARRAARPAERRRHAP